MRRDGLSVLLVLAGVTVFLFAGSFLFAQEKPATTGAGGSRSGETENRESITMDVKEMSVTEVIRKISIQVDRMIVVEPGIEDKITVNFINTPWLEALETACDLAKLVTRKVGNEIKVEKPPCVTMEFKKADLPEVINLLAKQAGVNIVIDSYVKGEVTMRFADVPWMKALDAVVKTAGYSLVEEDRGRIIRVVDPTKLQAQMETRIFKFKFIKPDEYYKAKIDTNFQVGGTQVQTDVIKDFTLLDALRNTLTRPPGATATTSSGVGSSGLKTLGRLDYFKDGNAIIVVDTKPVLDRMQQVIQELDVEPEQVLTDVTFVTTNNEDFIQMGINWANADDDGFTISSTTTDQNGAADGNSTTKYPFNMGERLAGVDGPGKYQGYLNNYGMTATLRLFRRDVDTEFIQRPNIATRTHMEATIFVGEEIHYAETEATTAQSGQLNITIKEAEKSPVKVGFQLFLIPHVVTGTNKILMTVIPQDESLTGTSAAAAVHGFNRFTAQSGATTATIDLPQKRQATIVTHMILESGQTMVVGGLVQDRVQHTVRKIPYAGDLPLLGWLFKRKEDQTTKDHLFVFITPRIVRGAQEEAKKLGDRQASRRSEMEDGYKWIEVGDEDENLRRSILDRNAHNAAEYDSLHGGPSPAGGGK